MSPKPVFAEVVLPLPLDKSFHYAVPEALRPAVARGVRVEVPFGRKTMTGYVVGLADEAGVASVKDVVAVIDPSPAVTEDLFELAGWVSGNYLCTLGEALGTIVPPMLRPGKRAARRKDDAGDAGGSLPSRKPELNERQRAVVGRLTAPLRAGRGEAFLLHGVTGSGKTEVYLALIEAALALGRSAVFLLPEISLTPQFVSIVRKRFPGEVGLWHSRLTPVEKYRTWQAARRGELRIMLGARSAVFAPFRDTGCIIIDEEHEPTYKQEQKPAYHTREVALARARMSGAVLVMGSATPSIESYFRAAAGEFALLELPDRAASGSLPAVRLVDTSRPSGPSKILSPSLVQSLERTLARREQAIVFLNRRGFAPGVTCRECGEVIQCPHCSVSLVYHRDPQRLRCHYCDHHQPLPEACPKCGVERLAVFGVGTQKAEDEICRLFPQGRVARLDRDTAARRGVYERVYEDFRDENCDILLGTQMVAKGFDFPGVTLVGVVDADTALYLPDFRASERTFQLITQVAGRSGRSARGGQVIVQTRHPDHYALRAAREHDFKGFYRQEIEFRRQLHYPPFCRLANILLKGRNDERVNECALWIGNEVTKWNDRHQAGFVILGPSPAARVRLQNLFRWQILLKGSGAELLPALRFVRDLELPSGVQMSIDIDPQNTL